MILMLLLVIDFLGLGGSQYLPINKDQTLLCEFGLVGANQWQVNTNSGSGVTTILNVKDEVHSIGGQLGLAYAPTDGHVASLALREGSIVVAMPFTQAMAFVDDSETIVVVQIYQINLRHVAPGQDVEFVFKTRSCGIFIWTVFTRGMSYAAAS